MTALLGPSGSGKTTFLAGLTVCSFFNMTQ
jgi:ABC-type Fe3+/spermidine/putrescine transport system ATPase subunit